MRYALAACTATIAALAAAPVLAQDSGQSVQAQVMTADGQDAGTVTFTQLANGVLVEADLQNLPEGEHGFHIHETGACEPDFQAAGGHYNPAGAEHGLDSPDGPHAGDLPNIHVMADGTAMVDHVASQLTLAAEDDDEAPFTLADADGSAIMVHAQPDDYQDVDSAGDRIACGVIAANGG